LALASTLAGTTTLAGTALTARALLGAAFLHSTLLGAALLRAAATAFRHSAALAAAFRSDATTAFDTNAFARDGAAAGYHNHGSPTRAAVPADIPPTGTALDILEERTVVNSARERSRIGKW
jgi:hypothetical protein